MTTSTCPQHMCIEISDVTVTFEQRTVLQNVNWKVPCGSAAAIIGPNGGGKSTLLRTIVGRVKPQRGSVRIMGDAPNQHRGVLSYIPQNDEIEWRFPLSVLDVVLQGRLRPRTWWKRTTSEDTKYALEALDRVGLADHAHRPAGDLSGGQKQRMLIARAISQNAHLILLDEPATALDAPAQHDLLEIIASLRAEGRTVIATTHDLNCLTDRFDTVLGLRGHVISSGTPQEALSPDTLRKLFGRHIPFITEQGKVTMIEHT